MLCDAMLCSSRRGPMLCYARAGAALCYAMLEQARPFLEEMGAFRVLGLSKVPIAQHSTA